MKKISEQMLRIFVLLLISNYCMAQEVKVKKNEILVNDTARELKSGKITNTAEFQRQVRKDIQIVKNQLDDQVIKIEWHALDGIDDNALKFIREEMTKVGLSADKFTVVVY